MNIKLLRSTPLYDDLKSIKLLETNFFRVIRLESITYYRVWRMSYKI